MAYAVAVEERQDDEAVGELDGDEIAAPLLAAIQQSYEEAKACIDGLARSSSSATPEGTEPYPGTEKIDLRLIKPPSVRAARTPPTAAMSLAARFLAERSCGESVRPSAAASGPRPERSTATARQEPEARAGHDSPDLAPAPRPRRRWWRP